mmetsp:Transcript_5007/g.14521  ORF Transcript_5007/g.14521 Transcript_5007/m.14521 type:complete len:94 (+) Transcript_5007:507-788(+)
MARSKRIHFRGFQSCHFDPPLPCHGVSYGHTILRGVVTNVSNRIEQNRTQFSRFDSVRFGPVRYAFTEPTPLSTWVKDGGTTQNRLVHALVSP